jgi:hypothetical protein
MRRPDHNREPRACGDDMAGLRDRAMLLVCFCRIPPVVVQTFFDDPLRDYGRAMENPQSAKTG